MIRRSSLRFNAVGLGGDPNYYYQDVDTGLPCAIDGYNYLRSPTEPADDMYVRVTRIDGYDQDLGRSRALTT